MSDKRILPQIAVAVLVGGLAFGCSTGPSEEEQKQAEFVEQFAAAEQAYAVLLEARTALAEAQSTIAELEGIEARRRTEEQTTQLEELQASLPELEANRDTLYEDVQTKLSNLLNVGLNEYPDLPETESALKMYGDEAILVADDIVAKSGDYKKAIEHVMTAQGYFEAIGKPVYQPLLDKIADLDDWRFITQERFDSVKNGMTGDEIREIAGVPYYGNIKVDEKAGVETWLYRKREGGAAAVYFKSKTGKTYSKKWDAVATKVVTDE